MGVALYIVSENKDIQSDICMDGKALADVMIETKLEALAKDNNITPLINYIQQTPEQIEDFCDELNLPKDKLPLVKFFSPEEGLKIIKEHQKMVIKEEIWIGKERTLLVYEDLNRCEEIFKVLITHHVKWYFAYDF